MSIAMSALVKPSNLLFSMVVAMCVGVLFVAGMVGSGQIGNLSHFQKILIVSACALGVMSVGIHTLRARKTVRLDISGVGQIRLVEHEGTASAFPSGQAMQSSVQGKVLRISADSTIWPGMLLLRLQAEDRSIRNFLILRDSLSEDSFRALTVACRWIAAHNNSAEQGTL